MVLNLTFNKIMKGKIPELQDTFTPGVTNQISIAVTELGKNGLDPFKFHDMLEQKFQAKLSQAQFFRSTVQYNLERPNRTVPVEF